MMQVSFVCEGMAASLSGSCSKNSKLAGEMLVGYWQCIKDGLAKDPKGKLQTEYHSAFERLTRSCFSKSRRYHLASYCLIDNYT